jgi:Rrf2 family protein
MLFSRSCQYAIQALVYLATQPAGRHVLCRDIADHLDIPQPYLSKIMQRYVQLGILRSSRGRNGGFMLARRPDSVTLMELIEIDEGEQVEKECLLGFKACADETACAMHRRWRPVKERVLRLLAEQNIGALARRVSSGHSRLGSLSIRALLEESRRQPA